VSSELKARVATPPDEKFRRELREAFAKPDRWYGETVDRAVGGACVSSEELSTFLARVKTLYVKRLLRAWARNPRASTSLRQLEEVVDMPRNSPNVGCVPHV